jgi:hypothetical protein
MGEGEREKDRNSKTSTFTTMLTLQENIFSLNIVSVSLSQLCKAAFESERSTDYATAGAPILFI